MRIRPHTIFFYYPFSLSLLTPFTSHSFSPSFASSLGRLFFLFYELSSLPSSSLLLHSSLLPFFVIKFHYFPALPSYLVSLLLFIYVSPSFSYVSGIILFCLNIFQLLVLYLSLSLLFLISLFLFLPSSPCLSFLFISSLVP